MSDNQHLEVALQYQREAFSLDVDVTISARGVTAIFGPSGCGKTTLLRLISGLERSPGRIKLCDEVWQDEETFLPTYERSIGYVFQEASLFPHLSVLRNLLYGFRRIPYRERKVKLQHAVALLGLGALLERKPQSLSGGERQRVAIARALLTSPRLLLMDEPMSALDQNSKAEILPYLQRLHDELAIPVLYVSHSADEVAQLADHLIVMDGGRIKAQGPIKLMREHLPVAIRNRGGHQSSTVSSFSAVVREYDDVFHLSLLDANGLAITVAGQYASIGETLQLCIAADDISIVSEPLLASSSLNCIAVTIGKMEERKPAHVALTLKAELGSLSVCVTRKSVNDMGLHPGKDVYALLHKIDIIDQ